MEHELVPMDKEEGQKLTDEIQAVLTKYNAEIGVTSSLQLLKRVQKVPQEFLTDAPNEQATDEETA